MRILMLVDFYPPVIGGMELHVRNLSVELAARGHQVSVATLWYKGRDRIEIKDGIRIYRIRGTIQRFSKLFSDSNRRFAPPIPDPELIYELHQIIKSERPDIIHAHSWLIYSFIPLKHWSKVKLVWTLHDYSLICPKKTLMYQDLPCNGPKLGKCLGCSIHHYGLTKGILTTIMKRIVDLRIQSKIDITLPVSRSVADGNGLPVSKINYQIIPNFIPDEINKSNQDYSNYIDQLPHEDFLLFVGALSNHKGINILLQAYSQLKDVPPLVMIGAVWSDTPAKFPENIHVLRNWPHEAVMEAWSRCLFGIAPSIWPEPCPTVVMEAMTCGRPVIASKIGGLTDLIVDNETGFLIEPGNPIELREAILKLVNDDVLRARMGKAGKERVVKFQAKAVVTNIEQVYQKLIVRNHSSLGKDL